MEEKKKEISKNLCDLIEFLLHAEKVFYNPDFLITVYELRKINEKIKTL